MANTYTQLYFHVVFAVKGRANCIFKSWKDELYKYIHGIIQGNNQKLIAINGMPDHIHLLIDMKPNANLSDLIRDVKANSSQFINNKKFVAGRFEWQEGFGAFTLGHSQLQKTINYNMNQEEHHHKITFQEEYTAFLKLFEIDFKHEYIFKSI